MAVQAELVPTPFIADQPGVSACSAAYTAQQALAGRV